MKRLGLLTIVVVSSAASFFSPAEKRSEIFANFSIKTSATDLTLTFNLASCLEVKGFDFPMNEIFPKQVGVCAEFKAHLDNQSNFPSLIIRHSDICPQSTTSGWRRLMAGELPNACLPEVSTWTRLRLVITKASDAPSSCIYETLRRTSALIAFLLF